MSNLKHIIIYTDGSALGNPGPGGYGVVLNYDGNRKELSGGYRQTTNNRMELMAAIMGLNTLKERCRITLYSDSKYVINAMSKGWAKRWKQNGWRRNQKDVAMNPDLWDVLLQICERHEVSFSWIKGHAGHKENERCDHLAKLAAQRPNLPADEGYESGAYLLTKVSGWWASE